MCGKGTSIGIVTMTSRLDIRTGSMYGMIDCVSCLVVNLPVWFTAHHNLTLRVDEQEVRNGHWRKCSAKRIHPEVIGEDGVSQCQMTSDSYSAKILKAVASLPSFFFLVGGGINLKF